MKSVTSSSDRQSIKQKRKRTITGAHDDPSNLNAITETSPGIRSDESHMVVVQGDKESTGANDRILGSTPKRVRRESSESSPSAASTKANITSYSPSFSTAKVAGQPTSPAKPLKTYGKKRSNMKPPSSRRPASPDTEMDDGVSIADSMMSTGKIRRTEMERQEYFKNEPECGILEEHRAECIRCGKFVALGRKQKYTVRPWEIHRVRCDQKPPKSLATGLAPNYKVSDEDGHASDKAKPDASLSEAVEQRKMSLEADPNISVVKSHEVLCRICGSWIRLSTKQAYKDTNWKAHSLSCKEAPTEDSRDYQPSTRVATATRKLQLVNDAQVKSFTPRQVICAFCNKKIISNGEGDYNIANWEAHKKTCTGDTGIKSSPTSSKQASGDTSTIPFPTKAPHSSASISTDDTLVASELNQSSERHSAKRPRENEGDLSPSLSCDPDARPSNRPRIEEGDSVSGWLILPFKAFVRGFKESLKRTT